MSAHIATWRIKCFESDGEDWLNTFHLGPADIEEIQKVVYPTDEQEMCGSYQLSKEMIEWLAIRFNNKEILNVNGDLFIERDT